MVGWLERGAPGREAWLWNTMRLYNASIEDKISIFRKLNNIMYTYLEYKAIGVFFIFFTDIMSQTIVQ